MNVPHTNKSSGKVWDTPASDKSYLIGGTDICGASREILKAKRTALNLEAGVVEAEVDPAKWPFKVKKGPGHPKNVVKH